MTLPLIVLAIGSIFTGWLGAPEYLWGSRWDKWLTPFFGAHEAAHGGLSLEISLMVVTLGAAALIAWRDKSATRSGSSNTRIRPDQAASTA